MACEAQDLEVLLAVVAALEHRNTVVNLEHALRGWYAADLAGVATRPDEGFAPRVGQQPRTGAAVVGRAHAIAGGAAADVNRELSSAVGRAPAAKQRQVGCSGGQVSIDLEHVERPAPLEPAALTRSTASAFQRLPDAGSQTQGPKHAFELNRMPDERRLARWSADQAPFGRK